MTAGRFRRLPFSGGDHICLVFGQTLGHDFVNYDDNEYVYDNPEVARGLTLKGIAWAITPFIPPTGTR